MLHSPFVVRSGWLIIVPLRSMRVQIIAHHSRFEVDLNRAREKARISFPPLTPAFEPRTDLRGVDRFVGCVQGARGRLGHHGTPRSLLIQQCLDSARPSPTASDCYFRFPCILLAVRQVWKGSTGPPADVLARSLLQYDAYYEFLAATYKGEIRLWRTVLRCVCESFFLFCCPSARAVHGAVAPFVWAR